MNMLPLSWFVDRLHRNERFAFSRYGDGEWLCITGAVGENGDHHPYSRELGAELAQTLIDPGNFQYAMGPKALHDDGQNVMAWLHHNAPAIFWVSTETFLEASLRGQLAPLVNEIKQHRIMMVGPNHLHRLPFTYAAYVETPLINCYSEIRRIEKEIADKIDGVDLVMFSAGMIKNVLIHTLFPRLGVAMLDMGSVWDMYCGVDSRRYARKMNAHYKERLKKANGL